MIWFGGFSKFVKSFINIPFKTQACDDLSKSLFKRDQFCSESEITYLKINY
jgi:hypothetical protein